MSEKEIQWAKRIAWVTIALVFLWCILTAIEALLG